MRTESPTLSASSRRLDDIGLDDAVFRVLALVQQGRAVLPASLAAAAGSGRVQARLRRCVPAAAAPEVIAAVGRSAAADAVVRVLAAPVRFPAVALHASWSAGRSAATADASVEAAAAAIRAVADYGAEIGLAHVVTGEVLKSSAAPRCWALRAEAPLATGAAPWPLAFDASVNDSLLLLVDLAAGMYRVQASTLERACEPGVEVHVDGVPDGAAEDQLNAFAAALTELRAQDRVLAYGARGSGGLLACVADMALAGKVGVALNVDLLVIDGDGVSDGRMDSGEVKNWTQQISGRRAELTLRALFAEEAGAVLQVRRADASAVMTTLRAHGLSRTSHFIGTTRPAGAASDQGKGELTIWRDATQVFGAALTELTHADPERRASARTARPAAPVVRAEMTHEEKIKALRMGM